MSRKAEKSSHDVWLAGLGALAVAEQEGSDLFKTLVKKGREFELELDIQERARLEPLGRDEVARRQAGRLEAAKQEFLKEFGGPARGRLQGDPGRWRREGKIFAVSDREATYVPGFQLDEKGQPRPAVARVIQLLGDTTSEWGLALWFAAANGWIDGRRPVDLLASAPEEVVEAAEREAEELVF